MHHSWLAARGVAMYRRTIFHDTNTRQYALWSRIIDNNITLNGNQNLKIENGKLPFECIEE